MQMDKRPHTFEIGEDNYFRYVPGYILESVIGVLLKHPDATDPETIAVIKLLEASV
jgi:hypothetical protein